MKILAIVILALSLGGAVLLVLCSQRARGQFEAPPQAVRPPALIIREPPAWLTFRTPEGVQHIRAAGIRSFSYSRRYRILTINDGTESPITIQDPESRHYAKLCQHFGVLPMTRILRGADHRAL